MTFFTLRTVPVSVTVVPALTATCGDGGSNDRTPTLKNVERRLSAAATAVPAGVASVWLPRATSVTSSRATRFDPFRFTVTSSGWPVSLSAAARSFPVTGTGPQLWNGEIVSYGSFTEMRYGAV